MTGPTYPPAPAPAPAGAGAGAPRRPLVIDVAGKPVTQGSKNVGRYGGVYESASADLKTWRGAVAVATVKAIRDQWRSFDIACPAGTPVQVEITFLFARPAGHFTRGASRSLRPNIPAHPATRPDIDKLTRAVLDALKTGRAYSDDGQVVDLIVRKRYTTGAMLPAGGAHIEIEAV
jgi:Holliday junction resolvase RusA-like endonuclease